ncbi:MAG: hypothetical protein O3B22_17900 [Proteobacteria bacterium]|nr:hypothetical protein [Pseudomonadota bacterium]MDA0951263.1 hypothetical protein [Pseudomonadota bacterium]
MKAATVVTVTSRAPVDDLFHALQKDGAALEAAGIASITRIGDCLAPGAIVHAVYAGHRAARELGVDSGGAWNVRRERIALAG